MSKKLKIMKNFAQIKSNIQNNITQADPTNQPTNKKMDTVISQNHSGY